MDQNYYGLFQRLSDIPLFEERNDGNELYRRTAVSAIYESTPVQQHFFSAKNIEHVQQLLKYNVYMVWYGRYL